MADSPEPDADEHDHEDEDFEYEGHEGQEGEADLDNEMLDAGEPGGDVGSGLETARSCRVLTFSLSFTTLLGFWTFFGDSCWALCCLLDCLNLESLPSMDAGYVFGTFISGSWELWTLP